ncbi:MAG: DUF3034 family protein [Gammaproteobacteria bacterium]|nr:DUF3034 family protein [Gammaproteobacteria bacterium]
MGVVLFGIALPPVQGFDTGSRLLATGGITQIEGAAGGGLVPWAVLSGYGQKDEWGGDLFVTYARTDDYALGAAGVSVAFGNRVEFSLSTQLLDIDDLADDLGLPDDTLRQEIVGVKARLLGDLIYGVVPQFSAGLQYKHNADFDVPALTGARDDDDIDFYLNASRLWLSGIYGYPVLVNVGLRFSRANQLGLLGFGGDKDGSRDTLFEASAGILLRRDLLLGYEYRQKPDNLSFAAEDDWQDAFLAWFPNKYLSLTGAWIDLGSVAGKSGQDGFYFSVEGTY